MVDATVLTNAERSHLVTIFSKQANKDLLVLTSKGYYIKLIQSSDLPDVWKDDFLPGIIGNPEYDAGNLIKWAIGQGGNPLDPRYSTLGTLLSQILPVLGIEDQRWVVSLILSRGLYRNKKLNDALRAAYQVPLAWQNSAMNAEETGPEIDWQGPKETVELQSWLQAEPNFLDVGFLKRAIECAASVCRVGFTHLPQTGTGFLVANDLVLTNYHVLAQALHTPLDQIKENARHARLMFGKISAQDSLHGSAEAPGFEIELDEVEPVVKASPDDRLDYALLRTAAPIGSANSPVRIAAGLPEKGAGMHILQHPKGGALQLALSTNGIVSILPQKGLVQYTTLAQGGSSGSPCFTDDWEVIALHHAQRSKPFGMVREGILMQNIIKEISEWIEGR